MLPALGLLALAGCSKKEAIKHQEWHRPTPSESEGNPSFAAYMEAAHLTAAAAPTSVTRSTFTAGDKAKLIHQLRGAVSKIELGTRSKCEFIPGVPRSDAELERLKAWRLIGRVLVWKVEDAVANDNWDTAITWATVALRFGIDLSQGGGQETSLGYTIASEARKMIAPHLANLSPSQLTRLAESTEASLKRADRKSALEREREQMLYSVQLVQDSYLKKNWQTLETLMFKDGREAIDYLKGVDEEESGAYFAGMAAEANEIADQVAADSDLGARERKPLELDDRPDRPWKRFSKHFFRFSETLLSLSDEFYARTKLLALNARLLAAVKAKGAAPTKLPGDEELKTDPYSGEPFVYRSSGSDYIIYSVGEDMRDDGGDTDEGAFRPDLRLDDRSY